MFLINFISNLESPVTTDRIIISIINQFGKVIRNKRWYNPSLTAKQKQNLLYPLGLKEILLVVQSIKM